MGNFFRSKVFKGTIILTIFSFLGKALSAFFKIGLSHLVGSLGIGIYQLVLPLLVFFVVLSSDGFALGLTIKIAEVDNSHKKQAYFKLSIICTLVVSLISAVVIVIFSKSLSFIQGGKISPYLYSIVALGVVTVSLLAILKAKVRGQENFKLYSISEIVEDVLKVAVGLVLGYLLLPYGIEKAVFGVLVGIVVSSLLSIILLLVLGNNKNTKMENNQLTKQEKVAYLKFSLVAVGSAIVVPAVQFIESAIIVNLLSKSGLNSIQATKLFGLSRGTVSSIINLPFFVLTSVEVLLLPNLARSKTNGIYKKKTSLSLFFALFISVPFAIIFILFAPIIMELLFGGALDQVEIKVASSLLKLGSVGIIFSSISTVLSVILSSNNKITALLFSSIGAGVVKILFLLIFVPKLSIYGVELSSVLFSMVMCLMLVWFARKEMLFTRPKNAIMSICLWCLFFAGVWVVFGLFNKVASEFLSMVLSIVVTTSIVGVILLIFYFKSKQKFIQSAKKFSGLE